MKSLKTAIAQYDRLVQLVREALAEFDVEAAGEDEVIDVRDWCKAARQLLRDLEED